MSHSKRLFLETNTQARGKGIKRHTGRLRLRMEALWTALTGDILPLASEHEVVSKSYLAKVNDETNSYRNQLVKMTEAKESIRRKLRSERVTNSLLLTATDNALYHWHTDEDGVDYPFLAALASLQEEVDELEHIERLSFQEYQELRKIGVDKKEYYGIIRGKQTIGEQE